MSFQPSVDSFGIRLLGFKCSWWHSRQANDVVASERSIFFLVKVRIIKVFPCHGDHVGIVHPESFRSNAQIAIAFARRNRPRVHRNNEFACVYLHSRAFAFAFVCEYCSRSCACVRAYVDVNSI